MHTIKITGFTLVELLASIAVIALITGFGVTGFQSYARYQEYEQAVNGVRVALNDARVQARAAESGQVHGVKFLASSVVVFLGTTYTAGAQTNDTYPFSNVVITTALSGGGSQVVFDKLTGRPNETGTVTIVGTTHAATTTLTISGTGVIQ